MNDKKKSMFRVTNERTGSSCESSQECMLTLLGKVAGGALTERQMATVALKLGMARAGRAARMILDGKSIRIELADGEVTA